MSKILNYGSYSFYNLIYPYSENRFLVFDYFNCFNIPVIADNFYEVSS